MDGCSGIFNATRFRGVPDKPSRMRGVVKATLLTCSLGFEELARNPERHGNVGTLCASAR